jgi:hypothetical protein
MTRLRYALVVLGLATVAVPLGPTEAIMSYPSARPVAARAQAVECPACHQNVQMVAVGGHLQCPSCTTVVESCCEGPIPSFTQARPTPMLSRPSRK